MGRVTVRTEDAYWCGPELAVSAACAKLLRNPELHTQFWSRESTRRDNVGGLRVLERYDGHEASRSQVVRCRLDLQYVAQDR